MQSYVATFLRQPELAKKNPGKIFLGAHDGGAFDRIFGAELSAEKLVQAQRLTWAIGSFVKQFTTHKRRKMRGGDWHEGYRALLGDAMLKYGDELDQVIPQSALFLSGLAYEEWVRLGDNDINELLVKLEAGETDMILRHLELLIRVQKSTAEHAKSWPTLLKSQSFFDSLAKALNHPS